MKFSVARDRSKWASRLRSCGQRALAQFSVALLLAAIIPVAFAAVPLPRPRPAGAPAAAPQYNEGEEANTAPAGAEADKAAPEVSACRKALNPDVAVAPSIPPIRGPGACGGEDLVRLEAVVLPDGRQVAVKPAAILRCEMAAAVTDWIRSDITKVAGELGSPLSELDNFDSFECRGRNRVSGAKLSEHGRANALDVRGLKLADGRFVALTDRNEPRAVREEVLHSVCARFDTVLGPGSDWYHEDHIHLDLAARRGGYRICQWGVYDPLPTVVALLPMPRPDEAPPRREAGNQGAGEADNRQGGEGEADVNDGEAAPAEAAPEAKKPALEPRRRARTAHRQAR